MGKGSRLSFTSAAMDSAPITGPELDLLIMRGERRIGIGIKRSDASPLTPSMRSTLEDLRLNKLWVVYPGPQRYSLNDMTTVVPLEEVLQMKDREFL
jgi:hypothetical protein